MLGQRGCRLALMFPDFVKMQTRAILKRAIAVQQRGRRRRSPKIMIPLVGAVNELAFSRENARGKRQAVEEESGVKGSGTGRHDDRDAAGALTADEIAQRGRLLQLRHERPDADDLRLQPRRHQHVPAGLRGARHPAGDPFQSLDTTASASWWRWRSTKGRSAKPKLKFGICGEHGGDPDSIGILPAGGLDYVSCSPFRVPIARLAAAQASIAAAQRTGVRGNRRRFTDSELVGACAHA